MLRGTIAAAALAACLLRPAGAAQTEAHVPAGDAAAGAKPIAIAGPGAALSQPGLGPQGALGSVLPPSDAFFPGIVPQPQAAPGPGAAPAEAGGLAAGGVGPAASMPASSRGGLPAAAQAQGLRGAGAGGGSAPGSALPDAGRSGDAPRSHVRELDVAVRALEGARQAELRGGPAAQDQALHKVYEAASDAPPAKAENIRDLAVPPALVGLPPSEQVAKLVVLADSAGPADAPSFYRLAAKLADDALAAPEAARAIGGLNEKAGSRAPGALRKLVEEAVALALSGELKGKQAPKVDAALGFWNEQAYLAGKPSLSNLAALKAELLDLQASAAARAVRPKVLGVRFKKDESDPAGAPKLVAEILREASAEALRPVPEGLAETLALPEARAGVLDLGPEDGLQAAFVLRPPAGAGARATFRRGRAEGRSWTGSLFAASAFWVRARAREAWELARRLWRRALALTGLAEAPERLAVAWTVELPPARAAALRGALARRDPARALLVESAGRRVAGHRLRLGAVAGEEAPAREVRLAVDDAVDASPARARLEAALGLLAADSQVAAVLARPAAELRARDLRSARE
ncbi:MAG: hypothetical protein HY554_06975, partial [Elusimicrobia bacterium]|nr:hypothetical protein [Elusimicrobiota bacterium]